MWSRCATTVFDARFHRAVARVRNVGWSSPNTPPTLRSPTSTADFVYARLQKGNGRDRDRYPPKQLDAWARRLQSWAGGGEPDDLPRVDPARPNEAPRDVFAYVIHEGKVRAPAGAMELIERVK